MSKRHWDIVFAESFLIMCTSIHTCTAYIEPTTYIYCVNVCTLKYIYIHVCVRSPGLSGPHLKVAVVLLICLHDWIHVRNGLYLSTLIITMALFGVNVWHWFTSEEVVSHTVLFQRFTSSSHIFYYQHVALLNVQIWVFKRDIVVSVP